MNDWMEQVPIVIEDMVFFVCLLKITIQRSMNQVEFQEKLIN
jgi:hypothetical protein